jgi:predicted phosphodiesterase
LSVPALRRPWRAGVSQSTADAVTAALGYAGDIVTLLGTGGSMRIAVLSDIHGNRTAFEAVLADLRQTSPDLILHGGDLADGGASPVEIVDRIRDLGWQGVLGNTDEMLFKPESLQQFANRSPSLRPLFAVIEEMAVVTREVLGEERLAWLRELPRLRTHGPMTLVHGRPETPWRAPGPEATDAELESVYGALGKPIAVYAHIHRPFVRSVSGRIVANSGSVGLSHDGDRRAAYLLLENCNAEIRRVEYDIAKELKALSQCGLPHADWVAKILDSASVQMP